jgi:hypothetical protein
VLRGKWLLDNYLRRLRSAAAAGCEHDAPEVRPGTLPPTIRERLAQHRTNPGVRQLSRRDRSAGFALENFDAIGGWRTIDESGKPVDAVGTTVGGASIDGIKGLRELLLRNPDRFPTDPHGKTAGLRARPALEYYDRPAVGRSSTPRPRPTIRWSSLILGIVNSPPFLMRGSS